MTETALKILMAFLMVIDHISPFLTPEIAGIFHFISRPVASVFAFFIIEGYVHTKDLKKYFLRLVTAAILMFIGNCLINYFIIKNIVYCVHNNIFITFAIGLIGLYVYDHVFLKGRKFCGLIILAILFILSIRCDYGTIIFPFIMICYIFKNDKHRRNLTLFALTALLLPTAAVSYETNKETLIMFLLNSDILVPIAGLPFIHFYNGERGNCSKTLKYFFYIFYPVHIWLISVLADVILRA